MEFQRYFRPHLSPSLGLPFGARSVGYYHVSGQWEDDVVKKHFFQLFWGVRGRGRIGINGKNYSMEANMIAIYAPGMEHQISACEEEWEYRWLTLDGIYVPHIIEGLGLGVGVLQAGPVPHEQFEKLSCTISNYDKASELLASSLAYEILCLGASYIQSPYRLEPYQKMMTRILDICNRYWADSRFNVNELASLVGIHRSRLSRLFKEAVKMSPNSYITQIRIDHACALLSETRMPMADVALHCGFSDPDYFARVFRKKQGVTPRDYRREREE